GLIYGVVMESRSIYMSPDIATARRYAEGLGKLNDRIGAVVRSWGAAVGANDAGQFAPFHKRIDQFQEFRGEVARRGVEIGPAAGREWGDNDANRSVTIALMEDIQDLARVYQARSDALSTAMGQVAAESGWILAGLLGATIMAAVGGMIMLRRTVAW